MKPGSEESLIDGVIVIVSGEGVVKSTGDVVKVGAAVAVGSGVDVAFVVMAGPMVAVVTGDSVISGVTEAVGSGSCAITETDVKVLNNSTAVNMMRIMVSFRGFCANTVPPILSLQPGNFP